MERSITAFMVWMGNVRTAGMLHYLTASSCAHVSATKRLSTARKVWPIFLLLTLPTKGFADNSLCADLRNTEINSAFVTSATTVKGESGDPPHCRVRAQALPQISIEILLPEESLWNGKYLQAGCGAGCGILARADSQGHYFNAMKPALKMGYATATTDSGHHSLSIFDLSWASESSSARRDWAWRSIGETERVANAIIDTYYSKEVGSKYFKGCSTGGRMALAAAAKYPELFDGIISGAPAVDSISQAYMGAWVHGSNTDEDGNTILKSGKDGLISEIVLNQCDAKDGYEDKIIADPNQCVVDFSLSLCEKDEASSRCLTKQEVEVIEKWYAAPVDSKGNRLHVGGIPKGSEKYWWLWLTGNPDGGPGKLLSIFSDGVLRNMAFPGGENYSSLSEFDLDTPRSEFSKFAQDLTITSDDLQAFREAGGKLVLWHGLADAMVSPYPTIELYDSLGESNEGSNQFAKLFLIPDFDHCGVIPGVGGIDQHSIDPISALDNWIHDGEVPETILK